MDPEEANSQNPAPQNPAPQPESQPMPNPEVTAPQTAPNPQVVPPQATHQQTPVAGKKSNAGIIIVIVLLIVLALIGGLVFFAYKTFTNAVKSVADNTFDSVVEDIEKQIDDAKNNKSNNDPSQNAVAPDNNPIIAANNKMRNELGSYNYHAVITSTAMDMDIDTTMDCTYDGKNKLEYCKTELFMGMVQESYYDWGNGYQYTKSTSPYSFAPVEEGWTKTTIPQGTSGGINIADGTTFTDLSSEAVSGGTSYTGSIKGLKTGADSVNNSGTIPMTMSFDIFVNDDGCIESMYITTDGSDLSQVVDVTYSDFGTAQSLAIPAEALNS